MIVFSSSHPIDAALDAHVEAEEELGRLRAVAHALFDKRPCDIVWQDAKRMKRLASRLRDLSAEFEADAGKQ